LARIYSATAQSRELQCGLSQWFGKQHWTIAHCIPGTFWIYGYMINSQFLNQVLSSDDLTNWNIVTIGYFTTTIAGMWELSDGTVIAGAFGGDFQNIVSTPFIYLPTLSVFRPSFPLSMTTAGGLNLEQSITPQERTTCSAQLEILPI
jgi:hypothetical protein